MKDTSVRKPILLIDCDDVMGNFCEVWITYLNRKYHKSYTIEDITDWDISKFYPGTKEEFFECTRKRRFWKRIQPSNMSQFFIEALEHDFDIHILTAGNYDTILLRVKEVIKKYFPFISEKKVICCQNKQMVKGDYLIDDNIDNLIGGDYKGILFTTPHNKNIDENQYGVVRVNNWKEAYQYLEGQVDG